MSDNKNGNGMIVDGFYFANEAEAAQAQKEVEGVKYIKAKVDMDNPEMVLNIYRKMVQQRLFETTVGFSYMKELQEYLQSMPFIPKEEILPIPVSHHTLEESLKKARRVEAKKQPAKGGGAINLDYKRRYRVMRAISIILAICVVAMFVITATTNNTTILNYETELINKYETWEQELNEREMAISEREQSLNLQNE